MSTSDLEPTRYGRCPVCNEASFPVHRLSPCGHDAEPLLIPFEDVGEVFSWTRTYADGIATPIAMADFLGGELRVTAPVISVDGVSIGDRLVVLSRADGSFVLAPPAA